MVRSCPLVQLFKFVSFAANRRQDPGGRLQIPAIIRYCERRRDF